MVTKKISQGSLSKKKQEKMREISQPQLKDYKNYNDYDFAYTVWKKE